MWLWEVLWDTAHIGNEDVQPANGVTDKDEDGWIQATPELFLPKAEEPTIAPQAVWGWIKFASDAFFFPHDVQEHNSFTLDHVFILTQSSWRNISKWHPK